MAIEQSGHEICDTSIVRLVDRFYKKVRQHPDLGPVFRAQISHDWQPHLNKMYDFWSSVLNGTGRYNGRPMPVHMNLKPHLSAELFKSWLHLFAETAAEVLTPDQADHVMEKAYRIANSFYMGIFYDPADPGATRPLTPTSEHPNASGR